MQSLDRSVTGCRKTIPKVFTLLSHKGLICNRPLPYSRYWTGTSLQLKLMWGVFSNANDILKSLFNDNLFPRMSLHCKVDPVQYREYEDGLLDEADAKR